MSERSPRRIISLLASGTELVCALGLGERLVGRSHECDFPDWVRGLPEVSRPTFAIDGTSEEIDARVRACLESGQPLYEVNERLLAELAPDFLITQTHCAVCAVSPADLVHGTPAKLTTAQVVAMKGNSLSTILEDFLAVACALDRKEEGAILVEALRSEIDAVARKTLALDHPRVAAIEWTQPLFAMGNWGPELIELAGGESILGTRSAPSVVEGFRAICDLDPDVLLISPCGFTLERAREAAGDITRLPGFSDLRAAKLKRVFVADGNVFFNRSSPSLFRTPRLLAEMLHPDQFPPDQRGVAWDRLG